MSWKEKIVWKRLIPFLIAIIAVGIIISSIGIRNTTLIWIKTILNSRFTLYFFWLLSVGIGIAYYSISSKGLEGNKVLIHAFGPFLDSTLTGVTYGALIQTSLTILSGLFNQTFFNEQHFFGFNSWDLTIIAFLIGYILYWSLMRLYRMSIDIFIVKDIGEIKKHTSLSVNDTQEVDKNKKRSTTR